MPAPRRNTLEDDQRPFIERLHRFMGGEWREERHKWNLAMIGACIEILENDRGTTTPFEHLICMSLTRYTTAQGKYTDPQRILESEFEEFQANFEDAIENARTMLRRHPDLVNALEED